MNLVTLSRVCACETGVGDVLTFGFHRKRGVRRSAVGRLSVGRLSVGRLTVDRLAMGRLAVGRLTVDRSAVGRSADIRARVVFTASSLCSVLVPYCCFPPSCRTYRFPSFFHRLSDFSPLSSHTVLPVKQPIFERCTAHRVSGEKRRFRGSSPGTDLLPCQYDALSCRWQPCYRHYISDEIARLGAKR